MANVDSIINSLQGIGTSKEVLSGNPSSALGQLLVELAQDVTDELRKSVEKYNIEASGKFKSSIKPTQISVDGGNVSIGVEADFYWKFLNYGVNGTLINRGAPSWGTTESTGRSFSQSIDEWIRSKGITLPPQFDTYESFNYVIRKSIREKGTEKRPFFTDVVNGEIINVLKEPIEKLLKRSIELTIIEPFK